MAKYLGVPEKIIQKLPSADLWEGQTDEGELGFSYRDVDALFYAMIDRGVSEEELVRQGFSGDFIAKVKKRMYGNEFKRRLPLIAKLSREGQ